MKAILIDPFAKTVTEVELSKENGSTLKSCYEHIQCRTIEAAYPFDNNNFLYCDEEALFPEEKAFFQIGKFEQPICGRALLVSDERGDTLSPTIPVDVVRQLVRFVHLRRDEVGKPVWFETISA